MDALNRYGPLTARILLSLLFIISGFGKIMAFNGTVQFMQSVGIPLTSFALIMVIIIEIGGGLSILLGLKTKWTAWILIGYTIIATLIFHVPYLSDQNQMVNLLKNLGIIGGFILLAIHGPGPFSLDKNR